MNESLYIHVIELSNELDINLELLAEKIKQTNPDKERIKEIYQVVATYEQQLERSIDLLQYIKRQLKTNKTQKLLQDIKLHYGE